MAAQIHGDRTPRHRNVLETLAPVDTSGDTQSVQQHNGQSGSSTGRITDVRRSSSWKLDVAAFRNHDRFSMSSKV